MHTSTRWAYSSTALLFLEHLLIRVLLYLFSWPKVETLKVILVQGRQKFQVSIAIKLVAIANEPSLAFSVSLVMAAYSSW